MASSLAEQIHQNFLQCGICLESFEYPRALPCLHAFCEECLEKWYKTNKKENPREIICPNCSKPAKISSEGIKGFPAHFMVNSLQETVNMAAEKTEDLSQKICTRCNKPDNTPEMHCIDCGDYLCSVCLDLHKSWKGMQNHRVVSIEDLRSGKVSLPDPTKPHTQDQNCEEHEGEQKRFYCETCGKPVCRDCIVMKQHCRDHDYMTLKAASNKQADILQGELKECSEKCKRCQDVLEKAERVKSELTRSAEDASAALEILKKEYSQQLDHVFSQLESKRCRQNKEKSNKLDQVKNDLDEEKVKLDRARSEVKTLLESGSYYDITSKYTSALKTLQDVNKGQLEDVDETLGHIDTQVLSMCVLGQQWESSGQFEVRNTDKSDNHDNEKRGPVGIALTYDNRVVVANYSQVNVYSIVGVHQHSFPEVPTHGEDVTVTHDNHIFFIGHSPEVCYKYKSDYEQVETYPVSHSQQNTVLTVDKKGCIIVGLYDGNICIQNNDDGSLTPSFKLPSNCMSISSLAVGEIVITTEQGTLEIVDYSGKSIHVFQPPPGVVTWEPSCVCCSRKYEVFVLNTGDPKTIFRYTAGGEFMGCVTTEVNDVRGMALSQDDQELYVTEHKEELVKIFKRP